jgi:threonine synthase
MIALGTAHAAKFPDAVGDACGVRPALPARLADLYQREERVTVVANDLASVEALVRRERRGSLAA